MNIKTELVELIDSLTPNEKAYISKYLTKTNKKDSVYLKLYRQIIKDKDIDLIKLNEQFKDSNISKNFSATFSYLYDQILNKLSNIEDKDINNTRIFYKINQIQFLKNKALYNHCDKIIISLKSHLEKYEIYELQILVLQIEIELISYNKKAIDKKNELLQIRDKVVQCLQLENSAQLQVFHTEKLLFSHGVSSRKIKTITFKEILSILTEIQKKNTSLKTKHYIAHALSNIAIVNNNYVEALNHLHELIQDYENKPTFKIYYIENYAKLLCNYINRMVSADAYDRIFYLETILHEISTLTAKRKIEKTSVEDVYITFYHAMYAYNLKKENFDEAFRMTQRMQDYKTPMERNKALFIIYHYDFACAAFYTQHYDLTLSYTNLLLQHENRNAFPDVHIFAKLLQQFTWYMKEEYFLLQSQHEAIRKNIQNAPYDTTAEKAYLKMLFKLSNTSDIDNKTTILVESESNIKSLIIKFPSALMFFNIFWWLKNEINRLK
ncbi:MAG TPA: hypothetical protein PK035_12065 [Chitinophagales bacterium]|nr:hypothetical protein [Chitinophagales bacterium]HNJ02006.1 hypothetical protein [Chitinophagales bacterium]